MKNLLTTLLLTVCITYLTSCGNSVSFLKDRNFNNGNRLLVNWNTNSISVIDDEKVLRENPNGIKVRFSEKDHSTTCDGLLKLFKDGKLVAEQMYLDNSCISESNDIKNAFKQATDGNISPYDSDDFKKQWDSLKLLPNCYPTIYHAQPEDKDIIWFYKYDTNS